MAQPKRRADIAAEFREREEHLAAFKARLAHAEGDSMTLADMLAEAVRHERATRKDSVIGRNGKATFTPSQLFACYVLDAAEAAYTASRVLANVTTPTPSEDTANG